MTTIVPLFRLGNAASARMDHVREKDIEMFDVDVDGVTWVRAGTGGISTSAVRGETKGIWWRLPAGYDHGAMIIVWNDYADHWSWAPTADMPLAVYRSALRSADAHFARV